MADPNISHMTEANDQFRTAQDLKSKGQFDNALTWFRRAVITDPTFTGAYIEIGRLCKDKSRLDPMFNRYAFEAYRKAARLDLNLIEAHDQYIMMAQQMGILDQLHDEYELWAKQNPNNEIIQRAYKNLVAISMALFSPRVQVGQNQGTGTLKKVIFICSVFTLLLSASLIFIPPLFSRNGKVTKDQIRSFFKVGLICGAAGLTGLLIRRRIE